MSLDTIKQTREIAAACLNDAKSKNEIIYDSLREAEEAEESAAKAKDEKAIDKSKSDCLTSCLVGEKGAKPRQKAMDAWSGCLKAMETQATAEKEKVAQQQEKADAAAKAGDDMNAQVQAYNDGLLLGEADPRYRPLFLKKDTSTKLKGALDALNAALAVARAGTKAWQEENASAGGGVKDFKVIKDRVSKLKFKKPK